MKRWITAMLSLLLLLSLGCTEILTTESKPELTAAPEINPIPDKEYGDTAGDLRFDTVTLDGTPIKAGLVGDYDLVILNCWAEWCGPCVVELPELERIHQEYPNVLILGVLLSDNVKGARQALSDAGVTYPALNPSGSLLEIVSPVTAIPTTMFYDKNGHEIADPIVGSRDYSEWKTIVENLLP